MIDCNKTIFYFLTLITSMSELEQDDIVETADAEPTNQDDSAEVTIDDYNKAKESLDKATSNYVLP